MSDDRRASGTATVPRRWRGMAAWGHFVARHRWWVLALWLVAMVVAGTFGARDKNATQDDFSIPGTGAQKAITLFEQRFASQNNASANVVFHATSGTVTSGEAAAAIGDTVRAIQQLPEVATVTNPIFSGSPLVSQDQRVAYAPVTYDQPLSAFDSADKTPFEQLEEAAEPARQAGLQVEFGGGLVDLYSQPESWLSTHADDVGLILAAIILLLAFGSIIGMGLPIGTALIGMGTSVALVYVLATVTTISTIAPVLGVMLGLGVGIDYSLLIVTRYRDSLHEGLSVPDAVARTIGTAGQAVLFAGATVCLALLGLFLVGIPFVANMGLAAAVVVAGMVVAALTLLPAGMAVVGHGIDRLRIPGLGRPSTKPPEQRFWARWARSIAAHPWRYVIASLVVLALLTVPLFSIRLGLPDDGSAPDSLTQRKAYDLLAEGFGPGFNGPLLVAAEFPTITTENRQETDTALLRLAEALDRTPGVQTVGPPEGNQAQDAAVIAVIPTTAPSDAATKDLVSTLRESVIPQATAGTPLEGTTYVGGTTATAIDLTGKITDRLPWVIAGVMAGAFILLMLVFRSILVPLKAVVMNLLSIGAAYGVVVAVFQWGWGASLIGLDTTIPIVSFVPLMMFVILFGLSMDYEVFLLSRIREEYERTGDNGRAVADGLAKTARVITSAATIMIAVFLSFVFDAEPTIKLMGLGMAVAVLIDATVVRLVLVPATMELLGDANWWLPRWLDRILPHLSIDAEPAEKAPSPSEPTREPVPAGR